MSIKPRRNSTAPIFTVHDARREKWNADALRNAKAQDESDATARLRARHAAFLREHPGIGMLVRNGRTVFYTYPVGGTYLEASDPEVLG
jgi:hypothetical protein